MKSKAIISLAAAVTALGLSAFASGQESIGIDYRDNTESTALAPSAVAGVTAYQQANWNSTTPNGQQPPNNLPMALVNSTGASTTATLSAWTQVTGNSWNMSDPNASTNSNALLMNALSDTGPSITVSNLDSNYTTNGYTVVVYYESNNTFQDVLTVTSGATTDTLNIHPTTSNYSSVGFVQGTSANTTALTNYAVFTGLTGSSVNIQDDQTASLNNGIAAIQLISNAPVVVPEPASLSLLGLASLGLFARRRKKA